MKEEIKSDVAATSKTNLAIQSENWFVNTKPRGQRGEEVDDNQENENNPKKVKSINE